MVNSLLRGLRVAIVLCLISSCSEFGRRENVSEKYNSQRLAKLKLLDEPLGAPEPGEWLFDHPEKGQSFEQYKLSNPVKPDSVRNTIIMLPLGSFTPYQDSVIKYTAEYLHIFFGLNTKILPRRGTDIISNLTVPRFSDGTEQLLTTDILNYLQNNIPQEGLVMMAVTSKDLYAGSSYNFVFGQARTKHHIAVSSLSRYYNGALDAVGYRICLERLIKTSAHEIGHMFSCQHCTNAVCIMNGTNNLAESDNCPNRLCSECHKKLHWNLQFPIHERIRGLKAFFQRHELMRDYDILSREMEALE
ncbi:archaemetzincin [Chryseosolibacter indicus]|uniref:Archaemetzincin n=1 Tax=Chryseosolibacter indicus TaxID=2782351 RepID=A0ABS5VXG1_9BACT|nr:archaemetzincin [Chryseosolibacter indicus]MBT1705941.1 archaemetzincin [Chryseosolibacter indicus]